jgi:hypothetical protein
MMKAYGVNKALIREMTIIVVPIRVKLEMKIPLNTSSCYALHMPALQRNN